MREGHWAQPISLFCFIFSICAFYYCFATTIRALTVCVYFWKPLMMCGVCCTKVCNMFRFISIKIKIKSTSHCANFAFHPYCDRKEFEVGAFVNNAHSAQQQQKHLHTIRERGKKCVIHYLAFHHLNEMKRVECDRHTRYKQFVKLMSWSCNSNVWNCVYYEQFFFAIFRLYDL